MKNKFNSKFAIGMTIMHVVFLIILKDSVSEQYFWLNSNHPYIASFLKFALLSTLGEIIGAVILKKYDPSSFGMIPRMVIWGVLGIFIAMAMKIFSSGAPVLLASLGVDGVDLAMKEGLTLKKVLGAFSISLAMNFIFAPVMMTVHKITDMHIAAYQGKIICLLKPINVEKYMCELDWKRHWDFVLKKTIPLFWIPAHTITFCLPPEYQVLFAALLGVALGVILSIAVRK